MEKQAIKKIDEIIIDMQKKRRYQSIITIKRYLKCYVWLHNWF